jgi:hypothetical protein
MNKSVLLIRILKHPRSLCILCATLLGFYLLNAFIANIQNILTYGNDATLSATLAYALILLKGFPALLLPSTKITLGLTGLFMGILIALMAYHYTLNKNEKMSTLAQAGLFLGTAAPGCAACCGIGLAATLGLGTVFASLPFQGKEISYLVLAILAYSIYRTLNRIQKGCELD